MTGSEFAAPRTSTAVPPTAVPPAPRIPRVLSIAGTDPTGGAGIQADLKSISAHGGYGMAVVTALVAQNTRGVRSAHFPPVSFLTEQLDAVSDDVALDAVKIGMLGTADIAAAISEWLHRVRPELVVLDPVMVATSGDRLLVTDGENALRALLHSVNVVTPNVPELAVLVGEPPATTWSQVLSQARRVSERFRVDVFAKGGHLDGAEVNDALVEFSRERDCVAAVTEFRGIRISTRNTHGTGCSLSSAFATLVARGFNRVVAARRAKAWLAESIAHGSELQVGHGNGPVHHFASVWRSGLDYGLD